jgi:hypothetical protein
MIVVFMANEQSMENHAETFKLVAKISKINSEMDGKHGT